MLNIEIPASYPATDKLLALILAGGEGKRLGSLTRNTAKPALAIGDGNRLIDFSLVNCMRSGISTVGVVTQYQAQSIHSHIDEKWNHSSRHNMNVDVLPGDENPKSLNSYCGTADAVYKNRAYIKNHLPEYVLILSGDHVYSMDYRTMLEAHIESNAELTIGAIELASNEAHRFGVLSVDEQFGVRDFNEKPQHPDTLPGSDSQSLVSMGVYIFSKDFLLHQLDIDQKNMLSAHDFGYSIIPSAIRSSSRLTAFPFTQGNQKGYWRDVGTLAAYWETHLELLDSNITGQFFASELLSLPSNSSSVTAVATINQSVLYQDVMVQPSSSLDQCVLLPESTVGENCLLQRCLVASGCHIPDGMVIGYDKEKDAANFSLIGNDVIHITSDSIASQQARSLKHAA